MESTRFPRPTPTPEIINTSQPSRDCIGPPHDNLWVSNLTNKIQNLFVKLALKHEDASVHCRQVP